jgi:hypothetical protein
LFSIFAIAPTTVEMITSVSTIQKKPMGVPEE